MEKSQYDEHKALQNIHWWFTGKREIVLDFARVHAGLVPDEHNSILDVGCGMGLMLDSLAGYGQVYGVDTEEEAVKYCNDSMSRDTTKSHRGGVVKIGSLPDKIPFQNNMFDYIFALDVLEHIEDDKAALNTLFNLLKPNGKLIITVPALMSMWGYNDEISHHYRRYEKNELFSKVTGANFSVIKYSFYNSYLFLPAWIVRHLKNILHIKTSDASLQKTNSFTNRVLKKIFASEKYRLRNGKFRIGVSLIMACSKNELKQ